MTEKKKIIFNEEILDVFKIYSRIGKRSVNESFVVVYDTQLKVVHDSGAIMSTYQYDSIGLTKPFALFDSNKLIRVINQFKSMKKDYELTINEPTLTVKAVKTRNKFNLFLVDFIEKGGLEDSDVDINNRLSSYVVVDDVKLAELEETIKTDSKVTFILTKADIDRINKYQKIMNTKDKFIIKKSTENGNITIVITDENTTDQSDVASFDIADGITENNLVEKDNILINFPLDFLVDDDYKITLNDLMMLEGVNKPVKYIIAPEVETENFDYDDDDKEFDDDFDDDFSND